MKKETNKFEQSVKDLKETVQAVQKGINDLKQSGLNEDLLIYAIQKAAQPFNHSYTQIKVGDIKAMISGIENLKSYIFPKENEK